MAEDSVFDKDNSVKENFLTEEEKAQRIFCPSCKACIEPVFSVDKRIKVVIATPMMGNIIPRFFDRWTDWIMHLRDLEYKAPFKFYFASTGNILTAWAREYLSADAVNLGADFILFVDCDMIFPFDIFERLYARMLQRDIQVDVITPLMFMRNPPHYPVIYKVNRGWDAQRQQEYYKTEIVKEYPKHTLLKVDAAGMGICLVRADVLRKMPPPWFMNTSATGEDVYFSERASRQGFGVYVDTTIDDIIHLGENAFVNEKFYQDYKKKGEQNAEMAGS